ncbi:MarR family winged helix-turn-helix transcriptional regulator [Streptomyces sp. ISL-66]|uniref:MarR family winged helix-turn-helix transcriptional regulator n=1 Tax=Streptomyces sp. ISL-66 TaxID=2819186 RepID=UPI0027E3EA94|nr:MarR family winged helix-turn-helix transcriptional regulator [Streptomyces sp. ISL-66]
MSIAPLSPSQLRVMYLLEDRDGVNLRSLAQALSISPAATSQLCDRIEAAGLLERVPNPHNGREVQVLLTGPGRTYLHNLRNQRRDTLAPVITALTAHDRAALLEGLAGLAAATGAADDPPAGRDARTA